MSQKIQKKEPYPVINALECKACGRCILTCRKGVLKLSDDLNERGYRYAVYKGKGCSGCGDCYYTCPEPLAIEVHVPKKDKEKNEEEEKRREAKWQRSSLREIQPL